MPQPGCGWPKTGARGDELRRRLVVDEALGGHRLHRAAHARRREGLVGPYGVLKARNRCDPRSGGATR